MSERVPCTFCTRGVIIHYVGDQAVGAVVCPICNGFQKHYPETKAGTPNVPGEFDATLKTYQIWSEGYRMTGDSGTAYYHGDSFGLSFRAAVRNFARKNPEFAAHFNEDRMRYWGCRLFDNEADARKSFG